MAVSDRLLESRRTDRSDMAVVQTFYMAYRIVVNRMQQGVQNKGRAAGGPSPFFCS